jgi:hypothetical protein
MLSVDLVLKEGFVGSLRGASVRGPRTSRCVGQSPGDSSRIPACAAEKMSPRFSALSADNKMVAAHEADLGSGRGREDDPCRGDNERRHGHWG